MFEHRINILKQFLKHHVTLDYWKMNILLCHHRNEIHFNKYYNRKYLFYSIFHQIHSAVVSIMKSYQSQTLNRSVILVNCLFSCRHSHSTEGDEGVEEGGGRRERGASM